MREELRIEKVEPRSWPRVRGVETPANHPRRRGHPRPKPPKEAPTGEEKGLLDQRA